MQIFSCFRLLPPGKMQRMDAGIVTEKTWKRCAKEKKAQQHNMLFTFFY